MLSRIFRFVSGLVSSQANDVSSLPCCRLPDNLRVYAIGDIHGRADLLQHVHQKIAADASDYSSESRKVIVYLGDYVDRGGQVQQVLDELIAGVPAGFEPVYLKGNHEELLLQFLDSPEILSAWLPLGGQATLLSYQVTPPAQGFAADRAVTTRNAFYQALPAHHLKFLQTLQTSVWLGDYFFVHAGVRPGVRPEDQRTEDILWIRDEFLSAKGFPGYCVVHGHSICDEPIILPHRISLDTGAYATGKLSCAVFEKDQIRLL